MRHKYSRRNSRSSLFTLAGVLLAWVTGKSFYNGIAQVPAVDSGGFAAFGTKYARTRLRLGYGEVHYHVGIGGHFLKALILGAQAAREWNTGHQADDPYHDVNSTLYGARRWVSLSPTTSSS